MAGEIERDLRRRKNREDERNDTPKHLFSWPQIGKKAKDLFFQSVCFYIRETRTSEC